MKQLKEQVLKYITDHASKEHRADRHEMAKSFNVNEREIRIAIRELRGRGERICSSSSGGGYWIAESEADYMRFRAEYVSRATKAFQTARAMDGAAAGQMEMMIL